MSSSALPFLIAVFVLLLLLSTAAAEDEVPYGVASWAPEGLGNHRAVVHVAAAADAVVVHIPWRRHDPAPESKTVLVFDAATGKQLTNVSLITANREFGDLAFQPATAPGDYFVYFIPFHADYIQWQFATHYLPPKPTADAAWLDRLADGKWRDLPRAQVVRIEARTEFDRFDPMEVIATAAETAALVAAHAGKPFLVFPEDRKYPIRMADALPLRWIHAGPSTDFRGEASRSEFYAFQLGVFAPAQPVSSLTCTVSDFRGPGGVVVPASAVHAFNFAGTDWLGRPIKKTVSVPAGGVQALWFGLQIPQDAAPGPYRGTVTLTAAGAEPVPVSVSIEVQPAVLADHGDADLWRMARLRWLDSTLGLDDEVVAPYTPLVAKGTTVQCLGRQVRFGATGLPDSILSGKREILAHPIALVAETAAGPVRWSGGKPRVIKSAPATVVFESSSKAGSLSMTCTAKMEADGYLNYRLVLKAADAARLTDLRLEIPFHRAVAAYMMGLGRKGGFRPSEWSWKWDAGRANNMVWVGDPYGGMQCKLKNNSETWDIYNLTEGVPESWSNGGKGGCTVADDGPDVVSVRAFTGARDLKPGEELELRFGLLITPVKPLDPAHWRQRYFHLGPLPVEEALKCGANIMNIHHGNDLNPFINYPFLANDKLAPYVARAHEKGVKVKIYYTVRELSNRVAEMFPLRSLGYEIFTDGGDGGHSWLQEHLVNHYGAAWHQPYPNGDVDAAIVTTGLSRWHNYYLEGLSWLMRNVKIDGLYLDGIGYDREIMKRVRKVMDRARPGCLTDFHSGNEFPFGDLRVSPANKYMEHFPYIDSLWFGEGYDYNETPDYWLVEVSGLPFGLFGEMLEHNGNPWRGMVYGMTARYYSGADPKHIWRLWDDFGIQDAAMKGYWAPDCPVKTTDPDVLATAYVKKGKTLVSIASWAKMPVRVRLDVDWKALGLDPAKAHLYAPAIEQFQHEGLFSPSDEIPVVPARGWLLIIDEAAHKAPAPQPDATKTHALLLEDRFPGDRLGAEWTTHVSPQGSASLKVAGGAIAIEAAANVYAYAERPLPAGVTMIECAVNEGTDAGATWGPGLCLVWPDKTLRINMRAEGRYGVDDGQGQWFGGAILPGSECRLRIRLEAQEVVLEVSDDGDFWATMQTFPRGSFPGDPVAVRVGKMCPGDPTRDHELLGPVGACSLRDLRAFGPKP
jgi:hypothetical protein